MSAATADLTAMTRQIIAEGFRCPYADEGDPDSARFAVCGHCRCAENRARERLAQQEGR